MKQVVQYTPGQAEALQTFIADVFGDGEISAIGHELNSIYVHTDVLAVTNEDGDTCFATCGMSARAAAAPVPLLRHVELMLYTKKEVDTTSVEGAVIVGELQRLSKFPFQNHTFFGPWHTIAASDLFVKTFGFEAFAFLPFEVAEIEGIGNIMFLLAVPVYGNEREKMMQSNTKEVLQQLEDTFGVDFFFADSQRENLLA